MKKKIKYYVCGLTVVSIIILNIFMAADFTKAHDSWFMRIICIIICLFNLFATIEYVAGKFGD